MKKCWVYWIRLPEHQDIFTQGYVGITTLGVEERFKRHLSAAKNKRPGRRQRVNNCLFKHGNDILVETVLVGDLAYCQDVESKLRPETCIGWNLAVGGAATAAGRKNSPEHVAKVALANRGKKKSPEETLRLRLLGESLKNLEPWEHPHSNKDAWRLALKLFDIFKQGLVFGRRSAARDFGIPVDSIAKVVNRIKSGWIPTDDPSYLTWLTKQKELHAPA